MPFSLLFVRQVLVDSNTLAQHDIADDHTVHMVSRPADAPPANNVSAAAATGSSRGQTAGRAAAAATGMQRPATRNASLAEMMGYDLPSRVRLVHTPMTAISVAAAAALYTAANIMSLQQSASQLILTPRVNSRSQLSACIYCLAREH
jgi:hypothetical protein